MATLYVTCGLQGSGKTTLARQLETQHGALRLTADEWLHAFYPGLSDAELDARRDGVERLQWRLTRRLLELGCDVVLDWGLWARSERDTYRTEAQALGASVVLCLLDPPLPELRRRLRTATPSCPRALSSSAARNWSAQRHSSNDLPRTSSASSTPHDRVVGARPLCDTLEQVFETVGADR